ncbi:MULTISPECIES: AMP-binding protein [Candidatus Ichthyocystis]|uniref:Long-chain-fatty-acid--CoA ligase n=1 Tax=Candidatus Ichthyocystis hellenicum TaxID=1561003 RepID=A0A0S4M1X8_9BURK|nr:MULTISPECIES: AMP-binding protein [Ichthyocystis]CUT17781.1 Long-chain-fatty-acid--CoA ligase [Candidatus Ichthyocystis hellenicum]
MNKPWLRSYGDIPEIIGDIPFDSLAGMFVSCVKKYGNKVAFHSFGCTMTYDQVADYACRFSEYLCFDRKLNPGERIALMLPNTFQYFVAFFGAILAGMVVVNVNPMYTSSELYHQLVDSTPSLLVVTSSLAHVVEEASEKEGFPVRSVVVTRIGDLLSFSKRHALALYTKYIRRLPMVKNVGSLHTESLRSILFKPGSSSFDVVSKSFTETFGGIYSKLDDVAVLQYTGGTTGVPRGAMLTHGNFLSNIMQIMCWFKGSTLDFGNSMIVTALPVYHIFSLTVNFLTSFYAGFDNLLIIDPRDTSMLLKTLRSYRSRANIFAGVNTLFNSMMNHKDFRGADFSGYDWIMSGGSSTLEETSRRWTNLTGTVINESYGLTETSPAVCCMPMGNSEFKSSIGVPIPSTDVILIDENNNIVPIGTPGEICIKGPQVMKGYWGSDDEANKVFTSDGYLRTGDIAVMDEEGFFRIVDRKKDVIIVSGFNVYPSEIEEVLAKCPKVVESAIVGVDDSSSGERIKAVIVPRDSSLTSQEVIDFCSKFLTRYKIPRIVEFRDSLPKSPVGKVLRRLVK